MKLRPADSGDESRLFLLHKELFADSIDQIWGWNEAWQIQNFRRELIDHETIVIHLEDVLAGFFQIKSEPDHLYLLGIAIVPEFQRKGLGSEVIRGLQQRAISEKKDLRLNVFKSNTQALSFYRRLGFRIGESTESGIPLHWTPLEPEG